MVAGGATVSLASATFRTRFGGLGKAFGRRGVTAGRTNFGFSMRRARERAAAVAVTLPQRGFALNQPVRRIP